MTGNFRLICARGRVVWDKLPSMSTESIMCSMPLPLRRRRVFAGYPLKKLNGVTCIADYADHPNEIKAVLKTVKQVRKGKVFVIFQPHTYSRTKLLFRQFVNVLSNADNLLIYRTYAAREYYDDAGSALTLSRAIKRSKYADGIEGICSFASAARADDTVLVLGAGDIYDIVVALVDH